MPGQSSKYTNGATVAGRPADRQTDGISQSRMPEHCAAIKRRRCGETKACRHSTPSPDDSLQPDEDGFRNARYLARPPSDRWSRLRYVTRLARTGGLGRRETSDGRGLARSSRRVINNSLLAFISAVAARQGREPFSGRLRRSVPSHRHSTSLSPAVNKTSWRVTPCRHAFI